jgi:hypothetical protein
MIARTLYSAVIAFAISAVCIKPAFATQCHYKPMLEAFLKQEHAMRLHSWGINGAGDMLELWLAPNGLFAVVTTTPRKCSTVELPSDLKGRLWVAPSPNKAIPDAGIMDRGHGI